MVSEKLPLYSRLTATAIEKLQLQSSASKAMVAIEVILSSFFMIVVTLFFLYDFVTIFFPPRARRSSEALIISSIVFIVSLLAIYGRERFEHTRKGKQKGTQQPATGPVNQLPALIFGAILLLFLMGLVLWPPPPQEQMIIRVFGSVFGGLISGFFLGSLKVTGQVPVLNKIHISAIGGFAVFCLVFFSWH